MGIQVMKMGTLSVWAKVALVVTLGLSLSACLTAGGSWSSVTTGLSQAGSFNRTSDHENAPNPCVNNLRIYHAHLQMPSATGFDLNKPVTNYIQESGSADAAISHVNADLNQLNHDLEQELAQRNPFNEIARERSDDAIATIEDGILLNEALAEAIECRR